MFVLRPSDRGAKMVLVRGGGVRRSCRRGNVIKISIPFFRFDN